MTIAWAITEEITRTKAGRELAMRVGASVAGGLGHERALAFCSREKVATKAAGEGSNAGGGFLVSEETEDAIMAYRTLAGIIRREGDVRSMMSDTKTFPRMGRGVVAGFVLENQPASEVDFEVTGVTVRAKKALAFLRAGSEFLEDGLTEFGTFIASEFGHAIADLEDACGWNGDGSSQYGGMTGICTLLGDGTRAGATPASAGHDTLAEIDGQDVASMMALLPEQFLPNAKFFTSSVGLAALIRLGATSFGAAQTATGVRPLFQYAGAEIVPTPKLAGGGSQSGKVMLTFGNLRATTLLGERKGLRIKTSDQRFFERDQAAIRASARFEVVAHGVGTAAAPGAMVALLGS